jgi:hypothetical protein
MLTALLLATLLQGASSNVQVFNAANKIMPGVSWKADAIVVADITCRGKMEHAIIGIVHSQATRPYIMLAVFADGLSGQPELFVDSIHNPELGKLKLESLDYDPKEEIGQSLRGFQRSKTCQGLNLGDGETDSFHIFWNHIDPGGLDFWRR